MNMENILDPPEASDDPQRVPLGKQKGKIGQPNQYTAKVKAEIERIRVKRLDPSIERALDIDEGRSADKTIKGQVVSCKVIPASKTQISCLMAGRTNGYWLLKRGRRTRCH